MNLTHADVEEILQILDASPFDELELETDRFKLILRRSAAAGGGWTQQTQTRSAPKVVAADAARAAAQATTAASAAARGDEDTVPVRAPLIGTFYRAPKPGALPYVEVGAKVTSDTVIGVVETMKLMNSVAAGVAGTIATIDAADGEFVEQNHVLMRVQPLK